MPAGPRHRWGAESTGLLAAALLLVSFNLRPAIASVSPLLVTIQRAADLSPLAAAMLTTLPLVCFGVLGLVTPRIVRRTGIGGLLLGCLAVLTGGVLLRSVPSNAALFAGTVAIGVGVAIVNVLMPGLVKKDFPGRVGLMTGLYTMALSAGPAVAGAVSVPLEHLFDGSWRLALGFWALPAALATLAWVPLRRHDRTVAPRASDPAERIAWRSPVAWALTAYMGLQSFNFYAVLAWLPTLLHDRGTSLVTSGLLLALVNVVGIFSALVTPVVAHRMHDQRVATLVSTATLAVGLGGLLLDSRHLEVPSAIMLGLGQGSAISLALMMMVLRAANSSQATALSGRAQGLGYLVAASGPALAGVAYSLSGGWTIPLVLLLAMLVPQLAAGWRAGYGHV
jgi:CP family cyanate transporter-like MFS transporter